MTKITSQAVDQTIISDVEQPKPAPEFAPKVVDQPTATTPEPEQKLGLAIAKPTAFDLDKFRSRRAAAMAGVETLQTALPVLRISEARDFVRLHPDEDAYWSGELCFVSVPIKGQKHDTLHLIEEDIAMRHLPSALVKRFRLALAAKPYDVFFLCQVPSQNIDNTWVASNLRGCSEGKARWVIVTSQKAEGIEHYKVEGARDEDAITEPNWPAQSLSELIGVTFSGRMIDRDDHPGLLRLIGAKQSAS